MLDPLLRLQAAGATSLAPAAPNGATALSFGVGLRVLSSRSECSYASVLISAERPDHYRL